MASDFNPLNWFANTIQAYKMPIIGGYFENPQEAEKQRTMAAAANYFQMQRPEQVQTQMNMLNNRLAAYQGAADVMASMGLPTQGAQYAGQNPFGMGAYGGMNFTQGAPGPGTPQLKDQALKDLARKNEPGWFGADHPNPHIVAPNKYDQEVTGTDAQGNKTGYYRDENGQLVPMTWSQYTGAGIRSYDGAVPSQSSSLGKLDPNKGY